MTASVGASIGLLLVYVVTSTFGLWKLKSAGGVLGGDLVIGFLAYAAGFLIWYAMLLRLPLSVAFPVAAGSLIVATQIAGRLLLGESLPLAHLGGVALILAGIALVFARV